ncbi:hypothetical protein NHG85_05675, partial [Limimaricola sp. ASW11-118]|nr:hypothetical protein [Limimaricola litoreus]
EGAGPGFAALERQKGMFSLLPFGPEEMRRLREDHAIYGTETGRINVAGLTAAQVGPLARALKQVAVPARHASAA